MEATMSSIFLVLRMVRTSKYGVVLTAEVRCVVRR